MLAYIEPLASIVKYMFMYNQLRYVACTVLVLASLCGTADASQSSDSGRDHAVLGEGRIGKFFWTSSIRSTSAQRGDIGEPCISVATEEGTRISELEQCGEVRRKFPLLHVATGGSGGRPRRTVVTAVFVGSARQLSLDLGGQGRRTVKLRRLSDFMAMQIGIIPIAYWVHAFVGPFCLHEFSVYDGANRLLSDSGPLQCRSQSDL